MQSARCGIGAVVFSVSRFEWLTNEFEVRCASRRILTFFCYIYIYIYIYIYVREEGREIGDRSVIRKLGNLSSL